MNRVIAAVAACLLSAAALAQHVHQPYAGQDMRTLKALSPAEIDDLQSGKGMGTAKAAELNRYPGPAHVLELKDRLGLTPDQEKRTRLIHESMQTRAAQAGRRVVDSERALDEAFSKGMISETDLAARVREAGRLTAEFRLVHLAAHLEMKALMSPEQVALYDELRGYAGTGTPPAHKH